MKIWQLILLMPLVWFVSYRIGGYFGKFLADIWMCCFAECHSICKVTKPNGKEYQGVVFTRDKKVYIGTTFISRLRVKRVKNA